MSEQEKNELEELNKDLKAIMHSMGDIAKSIASIAEQVSELKKIVRAGKF